VVEARVLQEHLPGSGDHRIISTRARPRDHGLHQVPEPARLIRDIFQQLLVLVVVLELVQREHLGKAHHPRRSFDFERLG
jgi:hypothetical protein